MSAAYRGKVLDAETKLPVPKARLEIRFLDMKCVTKSDSDGSFRLGPLKHFQVGIMTLEGLKPEDRRSMPERLFLDISRRDYQAAQLLVPTESSWVSSEKTNEARNGDLELGNILLIPTPKTRN
jgi:hypothetical protein